MLSEWLKQEQSDPQLIKELIEGLHPWQNGEGLATNSLMMQQQTCIGWDAVLDGWLGREWQATQAACWAQWKRRKSKKHTLLLKCYLSMRYATKKTHTGSVSVVIQVTGERGWLLGFFHSVTLTYNAIIHSAVAFLHGAMQQT